MGFWNKEEKELCKTEEWEKDFSGLEKWLTVSVDELDNYETTAKQSNVRLESKELDSRTAELWTVSDCDMEEFWNVYEQLNNQNN